MKKVSKLLSMLLVLVLVLALSLCGCGDKSKSVQGTWGFDFDMGETIVSDMESEFSDFESVLEIKLLFDFNKDGTFKVYVQEDSFVNNLDKWIKDFAVYNVEAMYVTLADMGFSKEESDAMMEEQFGGPMEDYMIQALSEEIDAHELIAKMEYIGVYEASGNKLYMNEGSVIDKTQYDLFEVSGDKLTFNLPEGADNESLIPGMEYPLVLTKLK